MAARPNLKRRQTMGQISTTGLVDPNVIARARMSRRQSLAAVPLYLNRNDDVVMGLEKPSSLAWKVLSNSQMQTLMPLPAEELQQKLAVIMDLQEHETSLEDAAVLDFYVSGFWWGKEQGWNEQQISALVTVHQRLIENVKAHKLSLHDNLTELRKMLAGIGTKDDQNGGLDFLNVTMATSLLEFLSSSFFQHYKLYEFLFAGERTEEVISSDLEVELVPPANLPHPPPLDEALPEGIYRCHVAPPSTEDRVSVLTTDDEIINDKIAETESNQGELVKNDETDEGGSVEDILAGVTSEEVQTVFDIVSKELFSSLQNHVALKLKERESEIIARINKIHRILDT